MKFNSASNEEFVQLLANIIKTNIRDENFGVENLVSKVDMSSFQIRRRLKKITGKTISQFICDIRVHVAYDMLVSGNITVNEVAFQTGFSSAAYFNRCFHDCYGYPPGEAKKHKQNGNSLNHNLKTPLNQAEIRKQRRKKLVNQVIVFGIPILILVVFLFHLIFEKGDSENSGNAKSEKNEKSIAVLPFLNDSPDSTNIYFINGITEAITDNLSKIADLIVISRITAEQYRGNKTKSIKQIAKELGVNYIVEGSGQKVGDEILLSIQLIETKTDNHLFSEQYRRKVEDIFDLYSEVAKSVAEKIKAKITPEEKLLIDQKPTNNPAAMQMYLRGNDLTRIANSESNPEYAKLARQFYIRAIQLDSTYAEPYIALSWNLGYSSDSAKLLVNKALKFNNKSCEAHGLKGFIAYMEGKRNDAMESWKLALKYNPNYPSVYHWQGFIYFFDGDFENGVRNFIKAMRLKINPSADKNAIRRFITSMFDLGFYDVGFKYAQELIETDCDSLSYLEGLLMADLEKANFQKAYNIARRLQKKYPAYFTPFTWGNMNLFMQNFKGAQQFVDEYVKMMHNYGNTVGANYYLGYVYMMNGFKKEAEFHFSGTIKVFQEIIENKRQGSFCHACFFLMNVYSAMGNKPKSMEYLKKAANCEKLNMNWYRMFEMKYHPMFDTIRDEPEFQILIETLEERYIRERAKVEKLLMEEGMI